MRLAEAVAALSLAIDIGMGQPMEQGLRTCLVATGLARKVGVDDEDARRVFYLALLRHVGCTAGSDMAAEFLGDEIAFRGGALTLDFTKPSVMLPYMVRHVGAGQSVLGRARHVGRMLAGSKRFIGGMDGRVRDGPTARHAPRVRRRTLDRDAFKDYVRMWRAGFPDVHCEIGDIIAEGDKVAWSIRATGTHTGEFMGIPPTGNTVDFDSLNLAEFRDGLGYRHTVMMDLAKMMQQLGVTP